MGSSVEKLREHLAAAEKLLESATNEVYVELDNSKGLKRKEFKWLLRRLENSDSNSMGDLLWILNYLTICKRRTEGKLKMNTNGRFELPGDGTIISSSPGC